MKTLLVKGNRHLNGEVIISGSKNCALCLIAGALLCDEDVVLADIPDIEDVRAFLKILDYLNVKNNFFENTLTINASEIQNKALDIPEIKKFRAAYYLIGVMLSRFGKVDIIPSGGCTFVKRPINYHVDLLTHFGVEFNEDENGYHFVQKRLNNEEYELPYPSFGTSVNAVLFAINQPQKTIIKNVTPEVEFKSFIEFLIKMGGKITLTDTTLVVEKSKLKGVHFCNIPDRIESGTFLLMGPIVCDKLTIKNINILHNRPILDLLSLLDTEYELGEDYVEIYKSDLNKSCFIETGLGDKMSSDLQPLVSVFCLNIPRISMIKEKVYKARFTHIPPLTKMGGFIVESNRNILINGIMTLVGQELEATDLRMAASLVFAALSAVGKSKISHAEYIDRGYEKFVDKLISLGADITVYEE